MFNLILKREMTCMPLSTGDSNTLLWRTLTTLQPNAWHGLVYSSCCHDFFLLLHGSVVRTTSCAH